MREATLTLPGEAWFEHICWLHGLLSPLVFAFGAEEIKAQSSETWVGLFELFVSSPGNQISALCSFSNILAILYPQPPVTNGISQRARSRNRLSQMQLYTLLIPALWSMRQKDWVEGQQGHTVKPCLKRKIKEMPIIVSLITVHYCEETPWPGQSYKRKHILGGCLQLQRVGLLP